MTVIWDWKEINKKMEELLHVIGFNYEVIGADIFDIRQSFETALSAASDMSKIELNIKLIVKPERYFVNEIKTAFNRAK